MDKDTQLTEYTLARISHILPALILVITDFGVIQLIIANIIYSILQGYL